MVRRITFMDEIDPKFCEVFYEVYAGSRNKEELHEHWNIFNGETI